MLLHVPGHGNDCLGAVMECRFRSHADFTTPALCIATQLNSALPLAECHVQPSECATCLADTMPPDSPNVTVRAVAVRLLAEHGMDTLAAAVLAMPSVERRHPVATPPRDPCRHLGSETRQQVCPTCSGSIRLKVFECRKHFEATIGTHLHGIACCVTCPDYSLCDSDQSDATPPLQKTNPF